MKVLAVVLMLAFSSIGYAKEPSAKTGAVIKKSKSGICHSPSSSHYGRTHSFTSFKTLDEGLKSGGSLPKG